MHMYAMTGFSFQASSMFWSRNHHISQITASPQEGALIANPSFLIDDRFEPQTNSLYHLFDSNRMQSAANKND